MGALAPGRAVRGADPDGEGGWRNAYTVPVAVEDVAAYPGPVAMYLTGIRGRRGGGRVHRTFLVPFDLDVSQAGSPAEVVRQTTELAGVLTGAGIACVQARSGPAGGRHLWTRCPAGLDPQLVRRIATAAAVLFPALDTKPLTNELTGALRPPGALHRHGGASELVSVTVEEAVAILRDGAPPAAFERLAHVLEQRAAAPALHSARAAHRAPDSDRAHQAAVTEPPTGERVPPSILERGPVVRQVATDEAGYLKLAIPRRELGRAATRTARRRPDDAAYQHQRAPHAPTRACVLAGWDFAEWDEWIDAEPEETAALEWLRTASTPGGGRRELTGTEARARRARVWWCAVQDAARVPRRPEDDDPLAGLDAAVRTAVADLWHRIRAAGPAPWNRPGGPSDRNALQALAYLMLTSNAVEISADVRRLAVLMGRSRSTAALALSRLIRDGWLTVVAESDLTAGTARRVALAESHHCTGDPHHICAAGSRPISAGDHGSDRSGSARRPVGAGRTWTPRELWDEVHQAVMRQQSGLWQHYGHHLARTLEAVEEAPLSPYEGLRDITGYTARTHARHLQHLLSAGLVTITQTAGGIVARRTGRSLYDAAADVGTASRPAERASVYHVERSVHRWWTREVQWCRGRRGHKPHQCDRPEARQTVQPGADPYARRYPRHPGRSRQDNGPADHATAWIIEATRLGAGELAAVADVLLQDGRVLDPAHLRAAKHTEPDQKQATPAPTAA